ncbi:MAG: hypothetical protein JW803_01435 [Endomicrobiales bacterium]|nr:hypothetical protein [Endomicrobiales bacterium]
MGLIIIPVMLAIAVGQTSCRSGSIREESGNGAGADRQQPAGKIVKDEQSSQIRFTDKNGNSTGTVQLRMSERRTATVSSCTEDKD